MKQASFLFLVTSQQYLIIYCLQYCLPGLYILSGIIFVLRDCERACVSLFDVLSSPISFSLLPCITNGLSSLYHLPLLANDTTKKFIVQSLPAIFTSPVLAFLELFDITALQRIQRLPGYGSYQLLSAAICL